MTALLALGRLALPVLRALWPYLLGAAFLVGLWSHGYIHGKAHVQREFDAFIVAQRETVGRITATWDAERVATEHAAFISQEHRDNVFLPIVQRSHDLPPLIRAVPVAPAVVELLDSAIATVNATPATGQPHQAPDPDTSVTQGALTDWTVDVLRIHRECVDRVDEWSSWYQGLREAQRQDADAH